MEKKINGQVCWIPESEQILLDKFNKELAEEMQQLLRLKIDKITNEYLKLNKDEPK